MTLTLLRKGKPVLTRSARFGYGRHDFALRPRQRGGLDVRLQAVDLAGNAATAAGALSVRPAAKRHKSN